MTNGHAAVHLWRLEIKADSAADTAAQLDDREQERAESLVDPETKRRFVQHHRLLRAILARYLSRAPGDIVLETSAGGKPRLAGHAGWHFNMAHSGSHLAIVLSTDAEVGVDIEALRPMPNALGMAERFFAPEDARLVANSTDSRRDVVFLTCWTRSEALLKCHGAGLRRGLDAVATGPQDNWSRQRRIRLDGRDFTLQTLNEVPDFCLAVAAESTSVTIRRESFPA